MHSRPISFALHRVRQLAGVQPTGDLSDQQLLGRFVAVRDQDAFAVLVCRHGAMVAGVCRRLLRDSHDAEDACQATFLILARKAASIRKRGRIDRMG
jgi:RNA polymerase sigma-70 factor (ECF subfamily)